MKRKNGLVKKAMELSLLCGARVCLTIVSENRKRVTRYSSAGDHDDIAREAEELLKTELDHKQELTNKNWIYREIRELAFQFSLKKLVLFFCLM